MAKEEGFAGRWSRLKREAREKQAQPSVAEPGDDEAAVALPPAERSPVAPTGKAQPHEPKPGEDLPFDPASLPDLESLTYESDYSAFLQKGVPVELRNQALRRLWRSSPVLANLDGLLEYGEDYSGVGTKKMVVRTAYRVGRGMIDRVLEETEQEPEAPGPAAEVETVGPTAETEPARSEANQAEAEKPETEEREGRQAKS